MANGKKSFWSSMAGLITGLAGVATAIVGLTGLAISQGWLGDKSGNSTTTSTLAPGGRSTGPSRTGGSSPGSNASSDGSGVGKLAVSPERVTLNPLGTKEQRVTVSNIGDASVSLQGPTITGNDKSQFAASDISCAGTLPPDGNCAVSVKLIGTGTGPYTAVLVIKGNGAEPQEVALESKIL